MDRALIPLWRAVIALAHVYSTTLAGRSVVGGLTAPPRYGETRETFAGVPMRVGWWRPGRGTAHPALMLVIGAVPAGIDFPELRLAADGLARAGFMVMIPDLPFLKEERLDTTGGAQIAAAFAALAAHPAAAGRPGAIGFSVGGGFLLAAAGREQALAEASAIAVLGAYFDLRTYIASVVSCAQPRGREIAPWVTSSDVPGRLATAAVRLARDEAERAAIHDALASRPYAEALARIDALPRRVRRAFDELSPSVAWSRIRPPVFWLHDERDGYVPVAEANAARSARPRPRRVRMLVLRLLQHAIPVADAARGEGIRFWVSELGRLVTFVASIFRAAT